VIIARVEPRNEPQKGEKVYLRIKKGGEHCFSVKTGERLPS
jgi:multiple sugar transport system ATP-binding protein